MDVVISAPAQGDRSDGAPADDPLYYTIVKVITLVESTRTEMRSSQDSEPHPGWKPFDMCGASVAHEKFPDRIHPHEMGKLRKVIHQQTSLLHIPQCLAHSE